MSPSIPFSFLDLTREFLGVVQLLASRETYLGSRWPAAGALPQVPGPEFLPYLVLSQLNFSLFLTGILSPSQFSTLSFYPLTKLRS